MRSPIRFVVVCMYVLSATVVVCVLLCTGRTLKRREGRHDFPTNRLQTEFFDRFSHSLSLSESDRSLDFITKSG